MDILKVNIETLSNLYQIYPQNFQGLSITNQFLCLGEEKIDISQFNINELLASDCNFPSFLSNLTAKDIFNIIKVHTKLEKRENSIPSEEEFYLLLSKVRLTEEEQKKIHSFLNFTEELKAYEDCLTPEAKQILTNLNDYNLSLFLNEDRSDKTPGQQALIIHNENSKKKKEEETKKQEEQRKLELKYQDSKGSIGILDVIIITLSFATILTFFTLYIIK